MEFKDMTHNWQHKNVEDVLPVLPVANEFQRKKIKWWKLALMQQRFPKFNAIHIPCMGLLFLEQAMKAQKGSKDIALLFL